MEQALQSQLSASSGCPGVKKLARASSNPAEPELMQEASSRVLSPEALLDSTALLACAVENARGFQKLFPDQLGDAALPSLSSTELSWGSACSGSEGAFYVAEALNKSFEHCNIPIRLKHKFSCEANKDKQRWIHTVLATGQVWDDLRFDSSDKLERVPVEEAVEDVAATGNDSDSDYAARHVCIFEDIQALGQVTAKCVVHHQVGGCPVPEVDVFVCGVSCKDVSRQNSRRDRKGLVFTQKESTGGSAQTWSGFKSFVSQRMPGLVIFENVDGLEDSVGQNTQSNLDLVVSTMAEFGYEAQTFMTDAHEFGLPARRRRLYIAFIKKVYHKFAFYRRSVHESVSMLRSMTASCVRSAPCASQVLLDSQDVAVAAGLQELQAKRARALEREDKAREKAVEKAKEPPVPKASSGKSKSSGQGWVEQHLKYSDKLNMRWGQPAGPELEVNEWFLTLSDREKDVLIMSRIEAPNSGFRNLSQSVGRVHSHTLSLETQKHTAPTMLPGQILFVEVADPPRLLLGREALLYLGFPVQLFLQKMAEHGFCHDQEPLPLPNMASGQVAKAKKRRTAVSTWLGEQLMMDLAGNAMALPVLLAIMQSSVCAIDFREETAVNQKDTDQALEALALLG